MIAQVTLLQNGSQGSCPGCGAKKFREHGGWIECDCDFAYLKSDIEKLKLT